MYTPAHASGSGGDAGANARQAYLIARLRNRQMTMEEATELFNIMQGQLQRSEAARLALMRAPPPSISPATPRPPPAARPPPPPGGSSDDFLLMGILAMGAGAGLLAAMTKRIQDVTPAPGKPTVSPSGSKNSSASR